MEGAWTRPRAYRREITMKIARLSADGQRMAPVLLVIRRSVSVARRLATRGIRTRTTKVALVRTTHL
eukprot:COSAG06_NODE_38839_length_419_cov_0.806250_1_plen_66_part_10